MAWIVQFTDSAQAQMASLGWEDAKMVEKSLHMIALQDPLEQGVGVGESHERRRVSAPPVQVVAWIVPAIETLTVVEVILPDPLGDPEPDPEPELGPVVPSWVVRPLSALDTGEHKIEETLV